MPRLLRLPVLALLVALVSTAGCAGDGAEPEGDATDASIPAPTAPGAREGTVVLVLPPADGLAPLERTRVRALVDRALVVRDDGRAYVVLEPATSGSLVDTFDIAVRRGGGDGTVCVLGTRARAALAPVLTRYPAARACVVPGPLPLGVAADRIVVGDVDLTELGRSLGVEARAAAGQGSVLLLDGGDALLDVRWRRGVEEGVLGAAGSVGPALGIVATAADALALLDAQAALIADGIVPGAPDAPGTDAPGTDGEGPSARSTLPGEGPPDARTLLPVTVVVLDAGPEATVLATALRDRGLRLVVPTSLLNGNLVRPDDVVLHWSVRWDVLLTRALSGPDATGSTAAAPPASTDDAPIVLQRGPGATSP